MRLFIVLLIALLAVPAIAGEETVVTADGGVSFTSGQYGFGPNTVDVATDGNAMIRFMWLLPADRDSIIQSDPAATYGDTAYSLRSTLPPRSFRFFGDGPDSAFVNLDTATEVIITW